MDLTGFLQFLFGLRNEAERVATRFAFTAGETGAKGSRPVCMGHTFEVCVYGAGASAVAENNCRKTGSRLRPQVRVSMARQNGQLRLLTVSWADRWQAS
jgi:hypothetical protein